MAQHTPPPPPPGYQPTYAVKPKRSFMGKLIKFIFIAFNILMLVWIIVGVSGNASEIDKIQDENEKAGAEIGTGLGVMALIFIWVAGDIILGMFVYFTRAKRY